MSSKKPVSRFREVIPANKRQREQSRDPRFDEKAGSFNEDLFKKSYSFLEEMRSEEKQLVEREARRTRNPERKTQLHHLLQQMVGSVWRCGRLGYLAYRRTNRAFSLTSFYVTRM